MSQNRPLAILFILLASAFVALATLLAKILGSGDGALHPLQISQGRFFFAFLIHAFLVILLRPVLVRPSWGLHLGRTLCGWAGISLMFAAVAHIALADATAISFLNPVFAMVFAIPLLGERVGRWRWAAAVIAMIGALILLRPGLGTFQPAALLALAAAGAMGLEVALIKLLTGRERPLQILFVNNGIGLVIATAAMLAFFQPPTGVQWLGLAALGGTMALAQGAYIQALGRAEASFVIPFSYATLVFAAFYDFLAFDVQPDGTSLAGAGVIILGGVVLAWREGVNAARKRRGGRAPAEG